MSVTTTDIKNRLGADRYYQLLSESALDEWDSSTTYSTGDRITQYLTGINYSASFISLTDSNTNNDPATDTTNWALDSLPAQQCLNSAELFVEAFVINRNVTYDDTNRFQKEAIILYAIGEVIRYGNQSEDGREDAGVDEREQAERLLDNAFKLKTEDQPRQAPYLYLSKSNITSYRSLSDNDPQEQFRQDYDGRDIGAESGY